MGKLRLEQKKDTMSAEQFSTLLGILREARAASNDALVFWDLDDDEDPKQVRRDFLHVAEKERIAMKIRRPRGASSLEFRFEEARVGTPRRLSAEESRERILRTLEASGTPMRKADIIQHSDVSPLTWNVRIKELLADKKVVRQGQQRGASYALA